jgi:teichuronic acid biosynthesis glycosyltransferase TuaC
VNILSISTVFPNPSEENLGLFVRARLEGLAARASVRVLAPVPLVDYARIRGKRPLASGAPSGPAHWPRGHPEGRLEVFHPRWFYPPAGGALNALFLFLRLLAPASHLDTASPIDLIDAHFGYPDGIAAALLAARMRRPFTVTLRGNETMHGRYRFRRMAMRWALRRAARVIAVSEALREYAISLGVEPSRIRTIPNGVDTVVFHPHPRPEARGAPKQILSAGYLIERKGHHHAIRATAALRARGVDCELQVAGGPGREGRFEDQLRRLVAELGLESAIHFLGVVPPARLAELMSAADVVLLPSSREGWPNVVNEALACGTPVVATNVGGVPDLIPSGEFGYVVPAGDQSALENALERALGRDWDREAIARWGASRSWDKVAAEVAALFGEVIAGP